MTMMYIYVYAGLVALYRNLMTAYSVQMDQVMESFYSGTRFPLLMPQLPRNCCRLKTLFFRILFYFLKSIFKSSLAIFLHLQI